jgi:hypothetical protein
MITISRVISGAACIRCSGGIGREWNEVNDNYHMWRNVNFAVSLLQI